MGNHYKNTYINKNGEIKTIPVYQVCGQERTDLVTYQVGTLDDDNAFGRYESISDAEAAQSIAAGSINENVFVRDGCEIVNWMCPQYDE